jgi:RecB family exonuclease
MTSLEHSRVVVAPGPRAVELELLDQIARLRPADLSALALPVRVIVPSASLRNHVVARLVRGAGRALAGVVVQTLQQVASEVIERAGASEPDASAAFGILVRRAAQKDRGLRRALDGLEDAFLVVEAAARDFLDAGFEAAHLPAVLEKTGELGGRVSPDRLARVVAVAGVAADVSTRLAELGLRRPEQLPQRAAELLRRHGAGTLPARAVVIHGFADLTGVAADLLQAVLAVHESIVLVDRPRDPAAPGREDAGVAFLDRLDVHLGGLARVRSSHEADPATADAFSAPTAEAELRQVAHRVRRLLDGGVEPETVGIVARELRPVAAGLRRQLDRLGIPYSGAGSTVAGGPVWRRPRLLAEVLSGGPELPAELWIEAAGTAGPSTDLLLALRSLGVSRLDELARLTRVPGAISLPLPVVDSAGGQQPVRTLAGRGIEELRARASAYIEQLASWPARASSQSHHTHTVATVAALGWDSDDEATREVLAVAQQLHAEVPGPLRVTRDEWLEVICRRLRNLGDEPVGGAGGGVQVLSAMEARARTFDHLYLIGLNRGVFPRVVQEDALLPDEVRGHLAAEVLPEFPVKARGLDEERYLFAQLMSASRSVTVSLHVSDEGSAASPSPFVERLRREDRFVVEHEPATLALPPEGVDDPLCPRPAFEHAILAAEHGRRDRLAPILAAAGGEGRRRGGLAPAEMLEWAEARVGVIERIDPEGAVSGPGPWAGLVGERARPGVRLPSITGVEDLVRCPLRALLVRRLGVSPMPDPRLGLPDTRGALVGSLVHAVLERVVEDAVGRGGLRLEETGSLPAVAVPWPDRARLEALLVSASEALAASHGLDALGIAPLLAAQARPYLEVARRVEGGDTGVIEAVVAAEVTGELHLEGPKPPIRFRADRLDRSGGNVSMVDYKTGGPPSTAKRQDTRHRHLLQSVAKGDLLQAVAYALAGGGDRAEGRYLYLKPELGDAPEEARDVRVAADDGPIAEAFDDALSTAVEAWLTGAMFARMEEPDGDEGRSCGFCNVAEVCLRDDSAVRRRLVAWLVMDDDSATPMERAARRLWRLGFDRPGGEGT